MRVARRQRWWTAAAALVAGWAFGLPATAHAVVPHQRVAPVLECVEHNVPGPGLYTAHWGYSNDNSTIVNISIRSTTPYNKFTPSPIDRGQPVFFSPGRHVDVFTTAFDGTNLVWTLTGPDGLTRTATASSNAVQRCAVCGDSVITTCKGEQCDDGNTTAGDGCSSICKVESGWSCSGEPSSCSPSCGDGMITGSETCDDGGAVPGDGCSTTCQVESGWVCAGAPSVCAPSCGNSVINGSELCDDGGTSAGDGCDAVCQIETGWSCTGAPSVCTPACGDGLVSGTEQCDDGNTIGGDGCSTGCLVDSGWTCVGVPSACTPTCGDGAITGGEICDDGNGAAGDGCSSTCQIESGWICAGSPSACATACGDGMLVGGELCDDGNATNGDGCDAWCQTETGWACAGVPSLCSPTCGDGLLAGAEECDDGALVSGDGCSGSCQMEPGWQCAGSPGVCVTTCGDGIPAGAEMCDDGGIVPGDGCNASCQMELGWSCSGAPSTCVTPCGDGIRAGVEQCDDGNLLAGDCCSSVCTLDATGTLCATDGNACTDDLCDGAGACNHSNNTASCDDGDACTLGDACTAGACAPGAPKNCTDGSACTDDVCTAGVCSNPPRIAPPEADFIFVVDTSKSMSTPWKTWLTDHLGKMPDRLSEAGIDWRLSIVRFATFAKSKYGATYPDVFLDWTIDAQTWRAALPQLGSNPRSPIEAGSEAIHWGLDRLTFRPNAIANIVVYTNEDDDAPSATTGNPSASREPPGPGPQCMGRSCEAKWLAAQARIDAVASRMIGQGIQLNMVVSPRDRPTTFQYGDPACTRTVTDGNLDLPATLACLASKGEERSLQGQLLSAGECTLGVCSAGRIGNGCSSHSDCSILARAYTIPKSRKQADTFFPGFLADKVREQSCTP